jgi:hypothetical protein
MEICSESFGNKETNTEFVLEVKEEYLDNVKDDDDDTKERLW